MRQIIQLVRLDHERLLAVCNDGTVWLSVSDNVGKTYGEWKPANHEVIRDIPQPTKG